MEEKRHFNLIRELILPVIIAVFIGGFGSFMGANIAINVLENEMTHIKEQVNSNTIRVEYIEKSRFTKESAELLRYRILEEVNTKKN